MKKKLIKLFITGSLGFFVLFASKVTLAQEQPDPRDLAQCLTRKNFVMYGKASCSSCALEKEYFGEAFSQVSYFDCEESTANRSICDGKGINAYPTWEDSEGKQYKGAIPLDVLAELSGCDKDLGLSVTDNGEKIDGRLNIPGISSLTAGLKTGNFGKSIWQFFMNFFSEYAGIFLAGVISFFAPCLIPLLPTYLSIITGYTFADLYGLDFSNIRGRVVKSALFFGLGFTIIFTLLGATGSIAGKFINTQMPVLLKFSGFAMIVFGLVQLKIIRIPSLEFDYAWAVQRRLTKMGFLTATLIGSASALCWIPCVGPILATILVLSANSASVYKGMTYLMVYSAGVMVPFLLAALYFPKFFDTYRENRRLLRFFSITAGAVIISFGLVLIFDKYSQFISVFYSSVKFLPINWSLERIIGT